MGNKLGNNSVKLDLQDVLIQREPNSAAAKRSERMSIKQALDMEVFKFNLYSVSLINKVVHCGSAVIAQHPNSFNFCKV
ncbi:hypothetical protein NCCP2331_12630 [Sporosarcina sp. NCCP-2331]|nr:hypothetical protein NCCP2331_12630 [Sporosarcina sp. NCCP-2331]GLB55234.1 hypothetical protein NCCP2378_10200 [Sporosarcina sp. NCCP-2378]